MLCVRIRHVGIRACRTRASAGAGRDAVGTGGHHAGSKTYSEVSCSHAVRLPWKGLPSLALALLILMLPGIAYGAPSVEVDGNFAGYEDGEEYKGYVVVDSPDNYQSTLCLIGEWSKLPQITTEQYETLSNPSTGGAFYELSQLWKKLGRNSSGTDEYYPQWLALSEDFADGLVTVYGYGKVWAAVCTDDLIEQAKQDFNTIIDGGSVGGGEGNTGGGSASDNNYVYIKCETIVSTDNYGNLGGICFSHSNWETVSDFLNDNGMYLWVSVNGNTQYGSTAYSVCFGAYTNKPNIQGTNMYLNGNGKHSLFTSVGNASANISFEGKRYYLVSGLSNLLTTNGYVQSGSIIPPLRSYYWGADAIVIPPDPEPSPDPWEPPTTPDTPTNPTTPTPKDPITPDTPTLPGAPSDPVQPAPPQSPTVGDGGTFTVDLQGILDALDEHCIHIQTCLNSNFSGQNSYLGELFSTYTAAIVDQIYNGDVSKIGAIGDVNNTIAQGFNDIFEYWDDYTEWLDKKLDFKIPETDPYDDEDLLNWLRKIYVRQGIGDVNTRPVDPATNYGGMTRWLGVLYGEITRDVSDTSITALSTSLKALQHTFPFSLPWDIQQILQALDATPATPAASITVPALAGAWDAYSYDIDLHWMDSAMVPVRAFELLAFVLYCLVHTKDVFGYVVGDA